MSTLFKLSEATRDIPQSPVVFGLVAFGILSFLLYLVLRLDK
jgi:hypothetical protein